LIEEELVLRRTTVVAMLRRSTGADDAAARRATETADRCKNMLAQLKSRGFGGERFSCFVVVEGRGWK
jgi:hypothetical protein